MKNKHFMTLKTRILTGTLLLSVTLCLCSCGKQPAEENSANPSTTTTSAEAATLRTFPFTVVDAEGNETAFEIETDKEIVGEALLEQGLIAGEDGQYGLYVKTVNGITADYDTDGTYWAFYINGQYATSGVDTTVITEGETYSFKVEK